MATSRIGGGVEGIDAITSRLTQTNLEEDRIEGEAEEEEDEDSLFLPEGPVSEEVRQRQAAEAAAEAAAAKRKIEDERTSAALSAACDMWSIENNEEAKAKQEARRIQDRLQQEHAKRMQALEAAEASRRADAQHEAAWKKWQEDKAQARLLEANRAAQEAEDKEAGQKQAEANALAIQNAIQREALEREWQEQVRANQLKEEADNRLRQELLQARDNAIAALNAANAEANAREWQNWEQQQAQSLARHEAILSGQAENATMLQQQQQHHHQQQQPQQHVGCFFFDDMEITSDEETGEGYFTATDRTWNTEGVGESIMDWEPVEEVMPLPAQPRLPLVPLAEPVALSAGNSISGSGLDSQMSDAEEISSGTATSAVAGTIIVAQSEGQDKGIIPSAASKKERTRSKAKKASPPRSFATVVPTAASTANSLPSFGEALKALRANSLTSASPPSPVPPPSPAAPPPPAPPTSPPPPPSPPHPASPPPAPLPVPSPPLLPPPAPLPLPPSPPPPAPGLLPLPPPPRGVLKVALPRVPIRPVTRPTVHPWTPLGRLLSRGQPFRQEAQKQVLGKRVRANKGEVGPEAKKAKSEGEFQYQVGGKRKRENETFPSRTRAKLGRALAVPGSRFAASQPITSPPILAPTSAPPISPAPEPPTAPPPQPPIAAIPPLVIPNNNLAETIAFMNDLPALRAEIAWMRAQRTTLRKATRGKKTPKNPTIKPTFPAPGYWEKYRET